MKSLRQTRSLARWLSYASFILAVLTIALPAWIEALFAIDPDHRSGVVEYLIAFALLLVGMLGQILARYPRATRASDIS